MTSEQKRVRPDTPLSLEDLASIEKRFNEKEMILNKKMDEIAQWQERLFRMQNEATKQQEELETLRREVELKERRIEELRKSFGLDFSGFRGFQRAPTPADQFVTFSQTPNISRPSSPQPSPRPHLNSTRIDVNTDLRAENQYLRRELESLRRTTQHTSPLPVPRTLHASIKLREIAEIVPKFDGSNISISQFARACRRALDSLPLDFTDETETSLTRLLITKLSGHAYLVVEGFKITKVETLIEKLKDAFAPSHSSNFYRGQLANEFKKSGEHVLDYFSRGREITQSIIDEESKIEGCLERRVERKIEEEGLDAFIRGLPKDYRTAMRFEGCTSFNTALMSLVTIDKQLKEDKIRNVPEARCYKKLG
ncbi:hypothetical protein M0802_013042 [Mischocyttarus mexicanus]|nr:hypothetical protein M0802_013042 [Mischocyttarus mexicanus]